MVRRAFSSPFGIILVVISVALPVGLAVSCSALMKLELPAYSEWTMQIDGKVWRPQNLTLKELAAMPRTTVDSEIYCLPSPGSYGFLVEWGNWTGVRLGYLLARVGVSADAVKVAFYAEDGFSTDLDLTAAALEDVILAYEKYGKPMNEKLRLIVPNRWGYKWIKYLVRIEVVDYDFKGGRESRGFPDDAWVTEVQSPDEGFAAVGPYNP
jgi:DMSO/TMAO reductase YedYZ molybdopterin-dependent catalytic subunit